MLRCWGVASARAARAQAYEGLQTAAGLREEYVLLPARVREVYLAHLLEGLAARGVRSAIVFAATCRGCHLLGLLLQARAALAPCAPERARGSARCAGVVLLVRFQRAEASDPRVGRRVCASGVAPRLCGFQARDGAQAASAFLFA